MRTEVALCEINSPAGNGFQLQFGEKKDHHENIVVVLPTRSSAWTADGIPANVMTTIQ